MKLHELTAVEGSTKERKRIGRGHGSGQGKTAGKGHKGQRLVQAEAFALALKVVKCLFKEEF